MSTTPPGTPPGMTSRTLYKSSSLEKKLEIESENSDLPSSGSGSSFSPADYRTLHKVLCDTGSSSPLSPQPLFIANSPSPRALDSGANESIISNYEVELPHDMEQFDDANEHNDGYRDEKDGMEQSDTGDTLDTREKDKCTTEYVMSLPGATVPSLPVPDFGSFYGHDELTSNKRKDLDVHLFALKMNLAHLEDRLTDKKRKVLQELEEVRGLVDTSATLHDVFGYCMPSHQKNIDPFSTTLEEVNEVSNKADNLHRSRAPYNRRRPASDAGFSRSTPFDLFQYFNDIPSEVSLPATMRNISYSPVIANCKDTENSSPKRRRKASSPEEISKLAHEAMVDEKEAQEEKLLKDLDQYRDFDLAPIEPVMESEAAGDLIICGTPNRAKGVDFRNDPIPMSALSSEHAIPKVRDFVVVSPHVRAVADEEIDAACLARPCAPTPASRRPRLPVEQDAEDDLDIEDWAIEFERENKDDVIQSHEPTFITVIGMLPAAMFWGTMAPVVKLGNNAVDTLVEKLTGLKF